MPLSSRKPKHSKRAATSPTVLSRKSYAIGDVVIARGDKTFPSIVAVITAATSHFYKGYFYLEGIMDEKPISIFRAENNLAPIPLNLEELFNEDLL
jgi:hypothetical protein